MSTTDWISPRSSSVLRRIIIRTAKNQKSLPRTSRLKKRSPGFLTSTLNTCRAGSTGSYRPLNDAIISGRIRGVVGLAGCNNPRITQDSLHTFLTREFIKRDVLVVQTGCSAHASAKAGYITPENAIENAGPGLREVCEAIGIPPMLHLGSCVDNSRILTIASKIANEGGLGDDIGGFLPAVGIAPEWMSEERPSPVGPIPQRPVCRSSLGPVHRSTPARS